jgi:hypothetical protein
MTGPTYYFSRQSVVCSICSIPLPLETSRTDEDGRGVHEECYVRKIVSRFRTASSLQLPENWLNSVVLRFQRKFCVTDNG